MRLIALIAVLLIALTSPAQTLREVLKTNGIPVTTFDGAELDGNVNAAAAVKDNQVLVVYMQVDKKSMFTGEPKLIQYNRNSGTVIRTEVKPEDANLCCGSPEDISLVDDFAIVSFHINPSAETMLVLSKDLKLVNTLYGFDVHQVGPGQVVFIENMIHFAPAHPERLQLADLRTGKRIELYPPQGDPLRAAFAHEHDEHMPSEAACAKMDDPCEPELYDEDIEFLDSDGHGNFGFTVRRDAGNNEEPESGISEVALYRYAWNGSEWKYCAEKLPQDQASNQRRGNQGDASPKNGCSPALRVVPDMSNADFSPFDTQRHE